VLHFTLKPFFSLYRPNLGVESQIRLLCITHTLAFIVCLHIGVESHFCGFFPESSAESSAEEGDPAGVSI